MPKLYWSLHFFIAMLVELKCISTDSTNDGVPVLSVAGTSEKEMTMAPDFENRLALQALRSRRRFLRDAMLLGTALPATAMLLSACGDDDDDADDPTATSAAAQPTATAAAAEPTATTAAGEPTATTSAEEPTATTAAEEPTATTAVEPTATTAAERPTDLFGIPIEPAENEGGTIVWGTHGGLYTGGLLLWNDLSPVFEAAVQVHPETFEIVPLLAEGWEFNDDGTVWTFTMREGVTFHDGHVMDAADLAFQLDLVKAIGWAAPPLNDYTAVADGQTLEVTFPASTVNAAYEMRTYGIHSADLLADSIDLENPDFAAIQEHPANTGADPAMVVGTGPFIYSELVMGDFERVTRYDGYWRGAPYLDEIVFRAVASADLYPALINSGEIDIAGAGRFSSLDPAQIDQFEGDVAEVVEYNSGSYLNLIFNLRPENPLVQDVRVRQALLYAIDREAVVEAVFFGHGAVPTTHYQLPGYHDESGITALYTYDPDQAIALLEEAGFVAGDDGVRANGDTRLEIRLGFDSANTTHGTTAAIVQENWRAIGVEAVLDSRPADILWPAIVEQHDFDTVFDTWSSVNDARYFFDCLPLESSLWGFCDEELDALMDEAGTELDADARMVLNTQVLNRLMEVLPSLPIAAVEGLTAVSPRLHNVHPYGVNNYGFNTETWWVEA